MRALLRPLAGLGVVGWIVLVSPPAWAGDGIARLSRFASPPIKVPGATPTAPASGSAPTRQGPINAGKVLSGIGSQKTHPGPVLSPGPSRPPLSRLPLPAKKLPTSPIVTAPAPRDPIVTLPKGPILDKLRLPPLDPKFPKLPPGKTGGGNSGGSGTPGGGGTGSPGSGGANGGGSSGNSGNGGGGNGGGTGGGKAPGTPHHPCPPIVIGCGPFGGWGGWVPPLPCGPVVVTPAPEVVVVTVPQPTEMPTSPQPTVPPSTPQESGSVPSPQSATEPPAQPAPSGPVEVNGDGATPASPLPASDRLLRVPVGATLTLQSPDLGTETGRLVLLVDKLALDATIQAWSQTQTTATLPALGIAEPLRALLVLVRADGRPASSVQLELMPADWQPSPTGQVALSQGQ